METKRTSKALKRLLLAAIVIAVAVGVLFLSPLISGPFFGGPMVQMLQPDGFTLVWRLNHSEPKPLAFRYRCGDSAWKDMSISPLKARRYEVTLDHLPPHATCEYAVQRDGDSEPLADGHVTLAPESDAAFRFIAFGDSGSGHRGQWQLAKLMATYTPNLLIHTGDVVYPEGEFDDYPAKFYKPYADLLRDIPIYPTIGNHDYWFDDADTYVGEFVLPTNGPEGARAERDYYLDYGDVRFVSIDTNEPFETLRDEVTPWLETHLDEATTRWKIVFFHHTLYTYGDHRSESKRDLLVPILDRANVDLVLAGHNHLYERSYPLRSGEVVEDSQGTVYITTGTGGGELQKFKEPRPAFLAISDDTQFSFTVIDVTTAALQIRQIGVDGSVIDSFSVSHNTGSPSTSG